MEEPDEVLLAITGDDEVVAHVELSLRYDIEGLAGVRTGYVEGLFVEEAYRASGVALKLLRAAESWARDRACEAFASDRDDRVIIHARYGGAAIGQDARFIKEPPCKSSMRFSALSAPCFRPPR